MNSVNAASFHRLLVRIFGVLLIFCPLFFLQTASAGADPQSGINAILDLNAGGAYYRGDGVQQDFNKARYYYQQAANLGNPEGQYALGEMLYEGKGGPPDFLGAFNLFQQLAKNDSGAQYYLGLMYYRGDGVRQNFETARLWFQKAAAWPGNNATAKWYLGTMYLKGKGGPPDAAQGLALLKQAADQGNQAAIDALKNMP